MQVRDEIHARMYVMLTLLSLLPIAVAVQVVRVGLVDSDGLREQGERQAASSVEISAMRGTILDRAGRTLVVNTARYDVAVDPTAAGFDARAEELYETLSRATATSASSYRARVRRRSSPEYVLLKRSDDPALAQQLREKGIPGLQIGERFSRRYNHGRLAAHVLGHVDADVRGLAGIEKQYDEHLTGTPGRRAVQRDRSGRIKFTADGSVVEPEHGETIVLTIDLVRQTVLEEELALGVAASGARWGTAIAMDPHTGAVLAMASVPTYDPNTPGSFPVGARRNHAVTDRLEPGSTFKLITAIAAVETGEITLADSVDTGPGWKVLHGRTLHDTHAYGRIPFSEVLSKSSNIGAAIVAERMDRGTFYRYARALGIGVPTSVDLPGEVGGLLKKPSEWTRASLASMSRGYEVEATPLQILAAYSALANGGVLVKPFVVAERRSVTGRTLWTAPEDSIRRAFDSRTAERLLPAFVDVVATGTATSAAVPGVTVAGKTGTAMKTVNGAYEPGAYRASFVGFFPAEAPEVAMIVVMDEPKSSIYGGSVAAPVFRETARRWLGTLPGVVASMSRDTISPDSLRTPNVTDVPASIATRRILAAGYRPAPARRTGQVLSQRPISGEHLPSGARMRMTLAVDDTTSTMPDMSGWSLRDATYWLSSRNLDQRITGSGTVYRQTPEPGRSLQPVTYLELR